MSQSLSVLSIVRWRQATTPHCCSCVRRTVELCVLGNVISVATTAWLKSCGQRGLVVVLVAGPAAECDHSSSQRPSHDLLCLTTSAKGRWRQWRSSEQCHSRLLHSPTHTVTHLHIYPHVYILNIPRLILYQ